MFCVKIELLFFKVKITVQVKNFIESLSILYLLCRWSLGNQRGCADLLFIVTKPSTTKLAYTDSSTLTCTITRHTKVGFGVEILLHKATDLVLGGGGGITVLVTKRVFDWKILLKCVVVFSFTFCVFWSAVYCFQFSSWQFCRSLFGSARLAMWVQWKVTALLLDKSSTVNFDMPAELCSVSRKKNVLPVPVVPDV